MDIGPGVVRAGVAVAGVVDRGEVAPESGGIDIESAFGDIDRRIARDPGRVHAVEGVRAVLHRDEDVLGFADAEHVPRLVLGQFVAAPADNAAEVVLLQRTADAVTVETRSGTAAH